MWIFLIWAYILLLIVAALALGMALVIAAVGWLLCTAVSLVCKGLSGDSPEAKA